MRAYHEQKLSLTKELFLCIFGLLCLGFIVQYSASYPLAMERYQDGFFYVRKQLLFLLLGILALVLTFRIPYRFWGILSWPLLIFSTACLVLVFIPPFGASAGGANRWLQLASFRWQPSELAKLALILFLSTSMVKKREKMSSFWVGVAPHILIPSGILILILLQPDFGTFFTLGCLIFIMLFIGGARLRHLFSLVLLSLPFLAVLIFQSDYRRKRFFAFLDPWADAKDSGFQIIQSQIAFHCGGLTGVGLGEGHQKMLFVPDIHTDFVFSVVGEELGFIGVIIFVLFFLSFTYLGLKVAVRAHRLGAHFACYLASGITLMISIPAFTNMAVVLGMLPTKGMVLPFLSYGGSALFLLLFSSGILLHLSRCHFQESFS